MGKSYLDCLVGVFGENTDGKGFLESLRREGKVNPEGKRAVVLGAGGAARAICIELALAGCSTVSPCWCIRGLSDSCCGQGWKPL